MPYIDRNPGRSPAWLFGVLALAVACGESPTESRPGPPATGGNTGFDGGAGHAGVLGGSGGTPGDGGNPLGAGGSGLPVPEAGVCEGFSPTFLRIQGWPGGGIQVVLAEGPSGPPSPDAGPSVTAVERADGTQLPVAVEAVTELAGVTAIVIVPSPDPAEHAERLGAARSLAQTLPEGERVGVWKGAGTVPLVVELTEKRAHVLARIDALPAESGQEVDAGAWTALGQRLAVVTGPVGPIGRNLVVVGPRSTRMSTPPLPLRDFQLSAATDSDAGGLESTWGAGRSPGEAAATLAGTLSSLRSRTRRVGACGPFTAGETLRLRAGDATCEFTHPGGPAHMQGAPCDAAAAARDEYPYPSSIRFEMTTAERSTHDALAAAEDESDFRLHVVLGEGSPIPASAHFRGQTSLECARKSYSVNLDGGEARRLMPGSASDEFYLISLCKESHYFRQVLMIRIMEALGLFPMAHRYVRLSIGSEERGGYLLLEKPKDTLLADQAALQTLVRRRLDPDPVKIPEAVYPDPVTDAAEAERNLAIYASLTEPIDSVAPAALQAALSERLDFDGYLSWMALATYFQCGDYVDETFFYGSPELGAPGGLYFRNHGWDMDDLFVACHHRGRFAYVDPNDIVYCAEGHLDRSLFASAEVYAAFVGMLENLMNDQLPPVTVTDLLGGVREDLFQVLSDDAVCAAMSELVALDPGTAACATMQQAIQTEMNAFAGRLDARRTTLRGRIDAWRALP